MRTKQEIFDVVVKHLLTQNACSITAGICRYRDSEGRKCAAGCLIPDDQYSADFEGRVASELEPFLTGVVRAEFQQHLPMIMRLQWVHDRLSPVDWAKQLPVVATGEGLRFNAP